MGDTSCSGMCGRWWSLDLQCCSGLLCEARQAGAVPILFEPYGEVHACSHGWASLSENAASPLTWWQCKRATLVCPNDGVGGC